MIVIELLPGCLLNEDSVRLFRDIQMDIGNKRSQYGPHQALMEWAFAAESQLRFLLPPSEIDRLVLTERFHRAIEALGLTAPALGELEAAQLRWRTETEQIDAWRNRWQQRIPIGNPVRYIPPAYLVILDTSMFINQAAPFDETDWHARLGIDAIRGIRLVVPMIVVDQLDNLKDRGPKGVDTSAREALKRLTTLYSPLADMSLSQPLPSVNGVDICVLEDPRGPYTRYPDSDAEVIRRAVALQTTTGRTTMLATRDVAMSFRARFEGLAVTLDEQRVQP